MRRFKPILVLDQRGPPAPSGDGSGSLLALLIVVGLAVAAIKGAPYLKKQFHQYNHSAVVKAKKIQRLEKEIARMKKESEKKKNDAIEMEIAQLKVERDLAREELAKKAAKAKAEKKIAAVVSMPAKPRPILKPFPSNYVQKRYVMAENTPPRPIQPVYREPSYVNDPLEAGYEDLSMDMGPSRSGSSAAAVKKTPGSVKKKTRKAKKAVKQMVDEDKDFFSSDDE